MADAIVVVKHHMTHMPAATGLLIVVSFQCVRPTLTFRDSVVCRRGTHHHFAVVPQYPGRHRPGQDSQWHKKTWYDYTVDIVCGVLGARERSDR